MPGEEVVAAVRTSAAGWQTDRGSTEELLRSWQEVRRQTTHQIGTTWPSPFAPAFCGKKSTINWIQPGCGSSLRTSRFPFPLSEATAEHAVRDPTAVSAISATISAIS